MWGDNRSDSLVHNAVSGLRRCLGESAERPKVVVRVGDRYRLFHVSAVSDGAAKDESESGGSEASVDLGPEESVQRVEGEAHPSSTTVGSKQVQEPVSAISRMSAGPSAKALTASATTAGSDRTAADVGHRLSDESVIRTKQPDSQEAKPDSASKLPKEGPNSGQNGQHDGPAQLAPRHAGPVGRIVTEIFRVPWIPAVVVAVLLIVLFLVFREPAPNLVAPSGTINILEHWIVNDGTAQHAENDGVISVQGTGGWLGGYVFPAVKLSEGEQNLILHVRNTEPRANGFHLELKYEDLYLTEVESGARGKVWVNLPRKTAWQTIEVNVRLPAASSDMNYFALSDHRRSFELQGVFLQR